MRGNYVSVYRSLSKGHSSSEDGRRADTLVSSSDRFFENVQDIWRMLFRRRHIRLRQDRLLYQSQAPQSPQPYPFIVLVAVVLAGVLAHLTTLFDKGYR